MAVRVLRSFCVGLVFMVSASASAQEQAPAPSFKDGDAWQFTIKSEGQQISSTERFVGTYESIYSQGQLKAFEIHDGRKTETDVKSDGTGSVLLTLLGLNDKRPTLKFPLSVGQQWKYEYTTRPAGARDDQTRTVNVTVAGIEQVTTPAGSFKAFKLVRKEEWPRPGRQVGWNSATVTYYYSPETRSVVKSNTANETGASSSTELIKFTPGQ